MYRFALPAAQRCRQRQHTSRQAGRVCCSREGGATRVDEHLIESAARECLAVAKRAQCHLRVSDATRAQKKPYHRETASHFYSRTQMAECAPRKHGLISNRKRKLRRTSRLVHCSFGRSAQKSNTNSCCNGVEFPANDTISCKWDNTRILGCDAFLIGAQ